MYLIRKYLHAGSIELAKERSEKALRTNLIMKDYATDWYIRRAATGRYDDLLGGEKLGLVLKRISETTPAVESVTDENGNLKFYPTANVLNPTKEKGAHYNGTNMWSSVPLNPHHPTVWHEAIGHLIYDELPWFKNVHTNSPWFRVPSNISGGKEYLNYLNGFDELKGDEKGANIWGFRGANRNMVDDNGNLYIDPARTLSGEDIKNMRLNGAIIPKAFDYISDEDVAKLHNLYASNRSNDDMFKFT